MSTEIDIDLGRDEDFIKLTNTVLDDMKKFVVFAELVYRAKEFPDEFKNSAFQVSEILNDFSFRIQTYILGKPENNTERLTQLS